MRAAPRRLAPKLLVTLAGVLLGSALFYYGSLSDSSSHGTALDSQVRKPRLDPVPSKERLLSGAMLPHYINQEVWQMHGPLPEVTDGSFSSNPVPKYPTAPLSRNITDFRDEECLTVFPTWTPDLTYPYHPVSVVIVTQPGEDFRPVMRTIHSVLLRSPPQLLLEVLLVDDIRGAWMRDQAALDHLKKLPKVVIIGTTKPVGLNGGRHAGLLAASGRTVLFLESYSDVEPGWLEPIAKRLTEDPTVMMTSRFDWEDKGTWKRHKGGVGPVLGFLWSPLSEHEVPEQKVHAVKRPAKTDPMVSPVIFGSAFAVNKHFFQRLGGFDLGYGYGGGGDNLELGFRYWMCGGRVENAPCSRLAVCYGKGIPFRLPPGHTSLRNKLRTAELWMGKYKFLVEAAEHVENAADQAGDLSNIRSVQEKLECKDFDWFLREVYPEADLTSFSDIIGIGTLQQKTSRLCLNLLGSPDIDKTISVATCNTKSRSQQLILLKSGFIMPFYRMEMCMDTKFRWVRCGSFHKPKNIHWSLVNGELCEAQSGLCLGAKDNDLVLVSPSDQTGQWEMETFEAFRQRHYASFSH